MKNFKLNLLKISFLLLIVIISIGSLSAEGDTGSADDADMDIVFEDSDVQYDDEDSDSDDSEDEDLDSDDSDEWSEDEDSEDEDLEDDDSDGDSDDEDLEDDDPDGDSDDEDLEDDDSDDEDLEDDDPDEDYDEFDDDYQEDYGEIEDGYDDGYLNFDPVDSYVKRYIIFMENYINSSYKIPFTVFMENETFKDRYNKTYDFVNSTSSGVEDFHNPDFFRNLTIFYLKTFANCSDDDLNRSDDFYSQLYEEFSRIHIVSSKAFFGAFSFEQFTETSSVYQPPNPANASSKAHDALDNLNPLKNTFSLSYSNSTSLNNSSDINDDELGINRDILDVSPLILIVILLIMCFIAII